VFGSEVRFRYRQKSYVYEPFGEPESPFLAGAIGRERSVTVGGPPEEKFALRTIPDWETANFFIDTSGEADGQKAAMQDITIVGQPLGVLRALVDQINAETSLADWFIAVNPITKTQDFWDAARRYRGHIGEIDLVFVPPNIWGGQSE